MTFPHKASHGTSIPFIWNVSSIEERSTPLECRRNCDSSIYSTHLQSYRDTMDHCVPCSIYKLFVFRRGHDINFNQRKFLSYFFDGQWIILCRAGGGFSYGHCEFLYLLLVTCFSFAYHCGSNYKKSLQNSSSLGRNSNVCQGLEQLFYPKFI